MRLAYRSLSGDAGAKLDEFFKRPQCFVEVLPGAVIMPRKFSEIGEQIIEAAVRPSDVWLVSYPRSGSTWAQEMVWLLGNRLDYAGAQRMQQLRTPLLELTAIMHEDHSDWMTSNDVGNSVQHVDRLPSPRFIKSHLPWDLLPRQLCTVEPKIIYIARNPKDLCVSYYHYCALVHGMVGTFDEFCGLFLADKLPIGSMWSHVFGFWQRRNQPNILFLKYEDMKRDLATTVRQCARFMDVDEALLTDANVRTLCEHLNFSRMQANPAVNLEPMISGDAAPGPTMGDPDRGAVGDAFEQAENRAKFIRKGMVGDWKNHMSADVSAKFDAWIALNTNGSDLSFDYE